MKYCIHDVINDTWNEIDVDSDPNLIKRYLAWELERILRDLNDIQIFLFNLEIKICFLFSSLFADHKKKLQKKCGILSRTGGTSFQARERYV